MHITSFLFFSSLFRFSSSTYYELVGFNETCGNNSKKVVSKAGCAALCTLTEGCHGYAYYLHSPEDTDCDLCSLDDPRFVKVGSLLYTSINADDDDDDTDDENENAYPNTSSISAPNPYATPVPIIRDNGPETTTSPVVPETDENTQTTDRPTGGSTAMILITSESPNRITGLELESLSTRTAATPKMTPTSSLMTKEVGISSVEIATATKLHSSTTIIPDTTQEADNINSICKNTGNGQSLPSYRFFTF